MKCLSPNALISLILPLMNFLLNSNSTYDFLKHLFGGPVGEAEQKAERNLPDALEVFDPFSASTKEVLKHKRPGGHKSKKTHAGKRGVGSYKREDMSWLKIIVKEFSEDPRPAYLKRVQKMADLLSEEVSVY